MVTTASLFVAQQLQKMLLPVRNLQDGQLALFKRLVDLVVQANPVGDDDDLWGCGLIFVERDTQISITIVSDCRCPGVCQMTPIPGASVFQHPEADPSSFDSKILLIAGDLLRRRRKTMKLEIEVQQRTGRQRAEVLVLFGDSPFVFRRFFEMRHRKRVALGKQLLHLLVRQGRFFSSLSEG